MNTILEIKNISRSFAGNKVLDGMDFTVGTGKIVGLLGPNGAGKTTLFRVICGLLEPDDGEILIDGKKRSDESNSDICYLPDRYILGDFRKVKDVLKYMNMFFPDFDEERARSMLKKLRITDETKLSSLSKGKREQVQLAIFLGRKTKLYLLDEPLGGVDPATRQFILDTILDSFGEENTIIISTHIVSDIERILDDVVMIKDGKVHLQGEADELREKYGKTINDIFKDEFRYEEGGMEDE